MAAVSPVDLNLLEISPEFIIMGFSRGLCSLRLESLTSTSNGCRPIFGDEPSIAPSLPRIHNEGYPSFRFPLQSVGEK